MVICIMCSNEMKLKIDSLLGKSKYKDYSEIVAVAIDNLCILEQDIDVNGALVINERASLPLGTSTLLKRTDATKLAKIGKNVPASSHDRKAMGASSMQTEHIPLRIPDLFLSEGLDRLSVATVDIPLAMNAKETYTLDQWLFGQYNKLLPAKSNCRALIRLLNEPENDADLDINAVRIAETATVLGDYLADYDRRNRIDRDNAIATAFPRSGSDAEKSQARYGNQFVGSVNNKGILSGLLWDYRLAALAPGEGIRLLPTKAAVNLARMANPILDGYQTDPKQKFSPEEVVFILNHICSQVPVEAFAFRTLIQAIIDGADTPDKLNEALRFLVPSDSSRSLSLSFLTSQRSGAFSRMADLGLIARVRSGVRVSYTVTEQGHKFNESK